MRCGRVEGTTVDGEVTDRAHSQLAWTRGGDSGSGSSWRSIRCKDTQQAGVRAGRRARQCSSAMWQQGTGLCGGFDWRREKLSHSDVAPISSANLLHIFELRANLCEPKSCRGK